MKRSTKRMLILAACAAAAGFLLAALGLWLDRQTQAEPSGVLTEHTLTVENCTRISARLAMADLSVTAADREDILVRWWADEGDAFTVQAQNGALSIRYQDDRPWYQRIQLGVNLSDRSWRIELEVPKELYVQLSLSATSGDITLDGVGAREGSTLSVTSGAIRLSNMTAQQDLSLAATSGDITLTELTAQSITVSQTSGELRAQGVACTGFETTHTSGDTHLERIRCETLSASATSGQIGGSGWDISELVELDVTSGDVDALLAGARADYDIRVSTGSGDANVTDQYAPGGTALRCESTSGDIRIRFSGE